MNSSKSKIGIFILGWGAALVIFFPILWMLLTGFKTEVEAISTPPKLRRTAPSRSILGTPKQWCSRDVPSWSEPPAGSDASQVPATAQVRLSALRSA